MEFELGPSERRDLVAEALKLTDAMEARRLQGPIFTPTPPAVVAAMREAPSESGEASESVLARLTAAAHYGWDKSSGGDLAYIPSGGLFTGAMAAWLGACVNAFTAVAFEAPGLVALEESVLHWMAEILGMAGDAEGILLSGGSLANQTAIACARDERRAGDNAVAYLSPRVHHSVRKGLRLSGIAEAETRFMATDSRGGIDVAGLRAQLARDQRDGLRPWLFVGVAGDTDTGSVDPLGELAELASTHGAWLHVDAAYGGFFMLTERGEKLMRGIQSADSVTLDAHKSLFLPYGVGALIVARAGALARAHGADGAYLRDVENLAALPHYFERGPENTRPFRGLHVWLPLHLHGVRAFREALDDMLDLAENGAARLRLVPGIEVPRHPELSIALFRASAGDASTQAILEALNASGRFHVSSTTVDGRATIRLAFLNPRSDHGDLDHLVAIVEELAGH